MVNKVILMGHVGKDPEVRHLDNNLTVARFTLATSERWNNKEGNRVDHTEWHNIVLWRNLADIAEKFVRKGTLLYLEGKIQSRSYDDKDGVKRTFFEIVADSMKLVGPKPEGAPTAISQQPLSQDTSLPSIETTNLETVPDDLPF